jgi:Mg-chelatase subunit ChlD
MMRFTAGLFLLFAPQIHAVAIVARTTDLTCTDLRVKSNDGDRKIAIVIDSSGSMSSSDPYDLRIAAGRSLNDFLITSKEATGTKKADLVTVIDFDDVATLDYPLGDPGPAANSSFSNIDAFGGTYIAGGVGMAIDQLTQTGSGTTADRSGIVVFTDGAVRSQS